MPGGRGDGVAEGGFAEDGVMRDSGIDWLEQRR